MELPFVVAILMAFAHCTDAQGSFPPSREDPGYRRQINSGYPVPHRFPPPPPPPPPRYPAPPASGYGERFPPKPHPLPPPPGYHGSEFSPPNYPRPAYPQAYSSGGRTQGDNERRWSLTSFAEWLPMPFDLFGWILDFFGGGNELRLDRPSYYPPPRFTDFGFPGLIDPGFSPHFRPNGFKGPAFPQYPKYPFPEHPPKEFPPPQENPENVSPPSPENPGNNTLLPPGNPGNNTLLPPGNPGNETLPTQIEPTPQPQEASQN